MWVYLTWLVLVFIMAGGGLSNTVGFSFKSWLVSVYLTWLVLDIIMAGVGLSNIVGYYHGWYGFI
jgi:hypothetical protein